LKVKPVLAGRVNAMPEGFMQAGEKTPIQNLKRWVSLY
jgi:hypothetical protein